MGLDFFITSAKAQAAPSATAVAGFDFMSLLPLILIFAVFYFLLIRPQQKKAQQQKTLLASLKRGDRVLTNGGIIGVITKVINEQELQIEIAEGVRVRVARALIADLLANGEPVLDPEGELFSSDEKKLKTKAPLKSTVKPKKKL